MLSIAVPLAIASHLSIYSYVVYANLVGLNEIDSFIAKNSIVLLFFLALYYLFCLKLSKNLVKRNSAPKLWALNKFTVWFTALVGQITIFAVILYVYVLNWG